jgi:hypothetical protein
VGLSEAEFKAWAGRLAAARATWVEPVLPVAKAPEPVTPADPKIRAERLFEGEALDGSCRRRYGKRETRPQAVKIAWC